MMVEGPCFLQYADDDQHVPAWPESFIAWRQNGNMKVYTAYLPGCGLEKEPEECLYAVGYTNTVVEGDSGSSFL